MRIPGRELREPEQQPHLSIRAGENRAYRDSSESFNHNDADISMQSHEQGRSNRYSPQRQRSLKSKSGSGKGDALFDAQWPADELKAMKIEEEKAIQRPSAKTGFQLFFSQPLPKRGKEKEDDELQFPAYDVAQARAPAPAPDKQVDQKSETSLEQLKADWEAEDELILEKLQQKDGMRWWIEIEKNRREKVEKWLGGVAVPEIEASVDEEGRAIVWVERGWGSNLDGPCWETRRLVGRYTYRCREGELARESDDDKVA